MILRLSHDLGRAKARLAPLVLVCADAVALLSAVMISILLRFDTLTWSQLIDRHLQPHMVSLGAAGVIYIYAFSSLRLYRCAWRFAGLEMLWAVALGNTLGLAGLVILQRAIDGFTYPASVIIMLWTLGMLLTGGLRVALRVLSTSRCAKDSAPVQRKDHRPRRAIIMGGGANGARTLRTVQEDPSLQYDVIGFLDDDPRKKNVYIHNVKVLGPLDMLKKLIANCAIDEVIVTIPNIDEDRLRSYVMECRRRKLPVKLVPEVSDVLNGKSQVHLVDFDVEDLLRRKPANTDVRALGMDLKGKRVMVTGAGGSIGSELCRQIISMEPALLLLLGHGENSIHLIHSELQHKYPHMADRIRYAIASVAHQARIEQVFREHRPDVVFHAAAHKHVPMMETNEQEAVRNNVLGTFNVAEACGRFGAERVVLISTDKAADPCCIMGVTKRLCEEVLRCAATLWPKTCFVTVRFGNVLGSRGSVVSIFRRQIKHGGPVTVTHPEMTRYFMTIPEAVRLVLQAAAVGTSGGLYLLEMGKPVKVLDLARDMIRLSGFEPEVDIQIEFTGIRPGEKMHERLVSSDESIEETPWEGLSLIHRPVHIRPAEISDTLERLKHASSYGTASDMRMLLGELVPGCKTRVESPSAPRGKCEVQTTMKARAV